ncbi:hypothetical protein [Chitinophaga nivalis]|uniref:DUF4595 domain-containing protein n=1 Tax=Chitinophaga nivalis TaxID=2991709 RepID=A0ABT3IFL9_9BACT|nr:hypothetical protein [Chitinophaga nivalis]MCW3467734.1 hypothetical protein [Chitinophaga nivalis]MCW3482574.1 hypothetical protein [Chitinophaga nivalis]
MKKHVIAAPCALIAIVSLLFTGCIKTDYLQFPAASGQQCKILQLKGTIAYSGVQDSAEISYNAFGNPVSITPTQVGTGYPRYLLRYDAANRLKDVIGAYRTGNPYFETWTKLTFNAYNCLVADTTFSFGIIGPNGPLPGNPNVPGLQVSNVTTYTYDAQKRLIRTTETRGHDYPVFFTTYYYNSKGNANKINESWVSTGTDSSYNYSHDIFPVYDNKVNPHQLHVVWQYLDRDYNNNNAFIATTYNVYGLPTRINTDPKTGLRFLLLNFAELNIKYQQ